MTKVKIAFTIVGIIILVILINAFRHETLEYLSRLGWEFWVWKFWLIVGIFLINHIFLTYGWRVLINQNISLSQFSILVLARIAGDATGAINALGAIAGEPLKALFVRDFIPIKTGLATIVLDRTIHTVANALLVLTGIFVAFFILPIPKYVIAITFVIFITLLSLLIAILIRQRGGIIEYTISRFPDRLVKKIMNSSRWQKVRALDAEIASVFTNRDTTRHFYVSLAMHYFPVLISGVLEIFLIVSYTGTYIAIHHAFFVYIFGLFLTSAIFFMPANIGTSEGSFSLAFSLLGYSPALGLSVGIIRRLRSFVWSAIGVFILMYAGLLKKEAIDEEKKNI
ncbi:MAG: flippase-like domain-containing protein [Spirochaetes bacterium]|nr:flippase-like domain-containing protein [Spirochaetota bacterium]